MEGPGDMRVVLIERVFEFSLGNRKVRYCPISSVRTQTSHWYIYSAWVMSSTTIHERQGRSLPTSWFNKRYRRFVPKAKTDELRASAETPSTMNMFGDWIAPVQARRVPH